MSHFLTGKLTSQVDLEVVKNNIIPRTFVAHITNPIKAYYARYTTIDKPYTVLFFTKNAISKEKIIRAVKRINKNRSIPLDAAKSRVILNGTTHYGIRVKGIQRFSYIRSIQELFREQGFVFEKMTPRYDTVNALVRVSRFFHISKISGGIYKSNKMEHMYYIEIPHSISWKEFTEVTYDVKNNIPSPNFDVIRGLLYYKEDVVDIIRVMKHSISIDELKVIQECYWHRMTKLHAIDNLI